MALNFNIGGNVGVKNRLNFDLDEPKKKSLLESTIEIAFPATSALPMEAKKKLAESLAKLSGPAIRTVNPLSWVETAISEPGAAFQERKPLREVGEKLIKSPVKHMESIIQDTMMALGKQKDIVPELKSKGYGDTWGNFYKSVRGEEAPEWYKTAMSLATYVTTGAAGNVASQRLDAAAMNKLKTELTRKMPQTMNWMQKNNPKIYESVFKGQSPLEQSKRLMDLSKKFPEMEQVLGKRFLYHRNPFSMLLSEAGQARLPFKAGDMVNVEGQMGKIVSLAKDKALVDIAGKIAPVALDKLQQAISKPALSEVVKQPTPKAVEGKIETVNPTGSVFKDYSPEARAKMELGKNITTLDKTMEKSPDETITIYRGAPKTQAEIVSGDFITTNKQLAKDYAGTGIVLEKKVKLSDILDDETEPLGEEYIYRPTPSPLIEQAKKAKSVEEFVESEGKAFPKKGDTIFINGNEVKVQGLANEEGLIFVERENGTNFSAHISKFNGLKPAGEFETTRKKSKILQSEFGKKYKAFKPFVKDELIKEINKVLESETGEFSNDDVEDFFKYLNELTLIGEEPSAEDMVIINSKKEELKSKKKFILRVEDFYTEDEFDGIKNKLTFIGKQDSTHGEYEETYITPDKKIIIKTIRQPNEYNNSEEVINIVKLNRRPIEFEMKKILYTYNQSDFEIYDREKKKFIDKSQLTDIWNEAHKTEVKPVEKPIAEVEQKNIKELMDYFDKVGAESGEQLPKLENISPEEAKQFEAEAGVIAYESGKSLYDKIKEAGGIKSYKGKFLSEEFKKVPIFLRGNLPADVMADALGFESDDELMQAIEGESTRLSDYKASKQYLKELAKSGKLSSKRISDYISKVKKIMSKRVPSYVYKKAVKEIVKPTSEKTITEPQALKRSLLRQEQVARQAGRTVKKETKDIYKLIQRVKKEPIQNMNYEERAQIDILKKELKTTRTLEGLKNLYSRVQALKEVGKAKYQVTFEARQKQFELDRQILLDTVKEAKKQPIRDLTTEHKKSIGTTYIASTLTPQRVFDKIDGGQNFQGVWHQHYYDRVNRAVNQELKGTDSRIEPMRKWMKENKITPDYLAHQEVIDGIKMTKDVMIHLYQATKNQDTLASVVFGNKIPYPIIQKAISKLEDVDKMFGDKIMADYENNWERNREELLRYTDGKVDLGKVVGYSPMRRTGLSQEPLEQELISEVLQRNNLKKAYSDRKHTYERKKINPEFQTPIRLGAYSLWMQEVPKQEHFISHGSLVKELQRMTNDKAVKESILNGKGLGPEYFDVVKNYVNRVANPSINKAFSQVEKMAQVLRGNAAIAYLAVNFNVMLKQLPSYALFLEDVGPVELLAGLYEFTTNYKEAVELIHRLSPQLKHRSIERELEEFKHMNLQGYNKILKKVGIEGMMGIAMFDHIATHAGWLSVYQDALNKGVSQIESAEIAEKSNLRTQPAFHVKDIADIYATNEFLNWFLQFTTQKNKIYNMLIYDIPMKARTGRYGDAMRAAIGILISQALIFILSGGLKNRDLKKGIAEQVIDLIPIIGPIVVAGMNWGRSGTVPALSGAMAMGQGLAGLGKENKRKAIEKLIEGTAATFGVPFSQPKRTIKGIEDLLSGETRDPRRLIYSERQLEGDKKPGGEFKLGVGAGTQKSGNRLKF